MLPDPSTAEDLCPVIELRVGEPERRRRSTMNFAKAYRPSSISTEAIKERGGCFY